MRYATNASGAWAIEDVDPSQEASLVAIALDGTGRPQIAYLAGARLDEAWLARREDDGWRTELAAPVVPDPLAARNRHVVAWVGPMALVIDGADVDHLFVPGGELQHVDDAGGAWASEQIPGTGPGGSYAIAAVQDVAGRLHTAWVEFGPLLPDNRHAFGISYASGTPGVWVSESVAAWETIDTDVALATDPSGAIHLAYVDSNENVVYARRDPD